MKDSSYFKKYLRNFYNYQVYVYLAISGFCLFQIVPKTSQEKAPVDSILELQDSDILENRIEYVNEDNHPVWLNLTAGTELGPLKEKLES